MKKIIKRNKILSILLILTIISGLIGILFNIFINDEYKEIITKNIVLLINNKLINYKKLLINNISITLIIWVLGISILGIILIIPIYLFKVFILFFEAISLLINLGIKNILLILLYLLPNIINTIVFFIICYYSVTYSIYLIRHIFRNIKYNMYTITKKYLLILIISLGIITISTLLEIFILPRLNIIKF